MTEPDSIEQCCRKFVARVFADELKDVANLGITRDQRMTHVKMWFASPQLSELVWLALDIPPEVQREVMKQLAEDPNRMACFRTLGRKPKMSSRAEE